MPELNQQVTVNFQLFPGQDFKFEFEMNAEEKAEFRKQNAQRQKNIQFSAEVKEHFDRGVQLMGQGAVCGSIRGIRQSPAGRSEPARCSSALRRSLREA
jgi:hypothetical protein